MALALSVWLVVSMIVFITVAYVGFIGVGVVGMLMWCICNLIELDAPVSANASEAFLIRRMQARAERRAEERAATIADRLASLQSIRFYRYLGAALTVVGIGGFVLFQI